MTDPIASGTLTTMSPRLAATSLCLIFASHAAADDELGNWKAPDSYTLNVPDPLARVDEPKEFGEKGTQWWTVGGGLASNFVDATDFSIRAAWSQFIVKDVEFSLELNAWYFDQPGDNAVGINPAFVFRWHFVKLEGWTAYADVGIGPLFTSDVVPEGGTSFDFMPRVGVGITRVIDDAGDRLQVGVRWHHISNARIAGDAHNPARDGMMVYVGVMFPF